LYCVRKPCRLASAVFLLLLSALGLWAQAPKPQHVLRALRTSEKIVIDGNLNDAPWIKAPIEFDFTQRDPIEGKEPSERTELRIVYDDTSIYFGARLFDNQPQKIGRQLSRRDNYADADRFMVQ